MSETKWTPGPWIEDEFFPLIYDSATGPKQVLIATVAINTRRDEGRHNARLIAAAPDLYDALFQIVDDDGVCVASLRAARAALAKARGEA